MNAVMDLVPFACRSNHLLPLSVIRLCVNPGIPAVVASIDNFALPLRLLAHDPHDKFDIHIVRGQLSCQENHLLVNVETLNKVDDIPEWSWVTVAELSKNLLDMWL